MSGSNRAAPAVEDVSGADLPDDIWDDSVDAGSEPSKAEVPQDDDADDAETEQPDAPEQADAEPETDETEEDPLEEEAQQFQPIQPPSNWPQAEQQFFRQMPPAMQHGYMQRVRHLVSDYTRKTQEIGQIRQRYAGIDRVIGQRERAWAVSGVSPEQALNQIFALSDFAAEKPEDFIRYFAEQRGIDLGTVASGASGDQNNQQGYVDPELLAVRKQVQELQRNLQHSQQSEKQRQDNARKAAYEQQLARTTEMVNQFASQTDKNGRLIYPFFNELEEDIAIELQSKRAKTVAEAYNNAVWANPQTRSKMLARSRSLENAKARAKAEAAKRAAVSKPGGNGAAGPNKPTGDMSLRETMMAAMKGEIS
jgi:hypothetical protein